MLIFSSSAARNKNIVGLRTCNKRNVSGAGGSPGGGGVRGGGGGGQRGHASPPRAVRAGLGRAAEDRADPAAARQLISDYPTLLINVAHSTHATPAVQWWRRALMGRYIVT